MKNMSYRDYVRCIRMMNDMFETPFLLSPIEFSEMCDKEKEEKNDNNIHGYMKTDVYRDGKHVSHEVKELKGGEWIPVEGKCSGKEDKCICDKSKKEDCPDEGTIEGDLRAKDEIIDSLTEANRFLAKENNEMKEQLACARKEMKRFADLMEKIERSFKEFTEK